MCLPLFYPCTQPVVMIVNNKVSGASARNHRCGQVVFLLWNGGAAFINFLNVCRCELFPASGNYNDTVVGGNVRLDTVSFLKRCNSRAVFLCDIPKLLAFVRIVDENRRTARSVKRRVFIYRKTLNDRFTANRRYTDVQHYLEICIDRACVGSASDRTANCLCRGYTAVGKTVAVGFAFQRNTESDSLK